MLNDGTEVEPLERDVKLVKRPNRGLAGQVSRSLRQMARGLQHSGGFLMDGDRCRFPTPAAAFIANLETEMSRLIVGGHDLPMTRNDGKRPTNYLCCPSAAYLDYAIDELRHFSASPVLKGALRGLIAAARPLMRASGLDHQLQPNNWLVSTNILPDLSQADIAGATAQVVQKWPDHAIVWRSVNDVGTRTMKDRFEAAGYRALASRRIYLFDCRGAMPAMGRDETRDRKLLAQGDLAVVQGPWSPADYERMAWLYQRLYRDKYSLLNPSYTSQFLEAAHADGWLDLHALRNADDRIEGVIGFYDFADTMTAPVVGYDTDLPAGLGLYRRLMAASLARARDRRLLYNMSAGAASFKRNRGATPALEYMMVYCRHLPWPRRLAIAAVRTIVNSIGIPLLRRFEL